MTAAEGLVYAVPGPGGVTVANLHQALLDTLSGTTVPVFDGDVPALTGPTYADKAGRVYPYAVVWPGPGATHDETALCGPPPGFQWLVQVTVAAGTPLWCLQALDVVRAALVGVELVNPHASPLVDETPRSQLLMRDDDVKPPRWFVPLFFGCVTTA